MKIVFIGCVEFSAAMLKCVLASPDAEVVGIVTKSQSAINSDFCDLSPMAKQADIDHLIVTGNDQEAMRDWIAGKNPDCFFCFGWSYLLSAEVLAITPIGVVGYHPTRLPANRGRHPLIWALSLGLTETGSTFFLMDKRADTGDILNQELVSISDEDNATSLYLKISVTAAVQIMALRRDLAAGTYTRTPQDQSLANE